MSTSHPSDAERLRALLTKLIACIEEDIELAIAFPEEEGLLHQHLWGQKETAVSLLLKLSALLSRVVSLQKVAVQEEAIPEEAHLTPEEIAIMERYYAKLSGEPYVGMPEGE